MKYDLSGVQALIVARFGWSDDDPGSKELNDAAHEALKEHYERIRAEQRPPTLKVGQIVYGHPGDADGHEVKVMFNRKPTSAELSALVRFTGEN